MTRNACMIVMTRRATFGDHENAVARRVHAYFLKTGRKSRVFRSVRPQILPVLNYMDFTYFYFFLSNNVENGYNNMVCARHDDRNRNYTYYG